MIDQVLQLRSLQFFQVLVISDQGGNVVLDDVFSELV